MRQCARPPLFAGFVLVIGLVGCAELSPTPGSLAPPAGSLPCFEPKPDFRADPLDCSQANQLLLDLLEDHDQAVADDLEKWNPVARKQPGAVRSYGSAQWKHLVEALYVGQTCWRNISQSRFHRLLEAFLSAKSELKSRPPYYDCSVERRTLANYENLTTLSK